MPRGQSLGMVTMLPEGDQTSQSVKQMKANMDVAFGGRVAEELILGKENTTSGASSVVIETAWFTAAAATVEGAKTLIEKTASDVGLGESLKALAIAGPRRDALALLLATATVVPLAKLVGLSPILGFLATGMAARFVRSGAGKHDSIHFFIRLDILFPLPLLEFFLCLLTLTLFSYALSGKHGPRNFSWMRAQ